MNIYRTTDTKLVESVLADPSCYTPEDGGVAYYEFEAPDDPRIIYLVVEDRHTFGVIVFMPMSQSLYQVHVSFLPERRVGAIQGFRAACRWLLESTATSIVGFVPESNVLAQRFATLAGFRRAGMLPCAFLRNGQAEPLIVYEVHKCLVQ